MIERVEAQGIEDIVQSGLKGMADQMEDADFAPATREGINYLKDQLESSSAKRDTFEKGIDAYNSIPGVPQLREALNLTDDYKFSFYVLKQPDAFNSALRDVRSAASEANMSMSDLTEPEVSGVLARSLADGREFMRLENQPNRMRRMFLRRERRGDRKERTLVRKAGLLGVEKKAGEVSRLPVSQANKMSDEESQELMQGVGEGIGVKDPPSTKVATKQERIDVLKEKLKDARNADADEIRSQIKQLESQETINQPKSSQSQETSDQPKSSQSGVVDRITGKEVSATRERLEAEGREDFINILKSMDLFKEGDDNKSLRVLFEEHPDLIQVRGSAIPISAIPSNVQYMTNEERNPVYLDPDFGPALRFFNANESKITASEKPAFRYKLDRLSILVGQAQRGDATAASQISDLVGSDPTLAQFVDERLPANIDQNETVFDAITSSSYKTLGRQSPFQVQQKTTPSPNAPDVLLNLGADQDVEFGDKTKRFVPPPPDRDFKFVPPPPDRDFNFRQPETEQTQSTDTSTPGGTSVLGGDIKQEKASAKRESRSSRLAQLFKKEDYESDINKSQDFG